MKNLFEALFLYTERRLNKTSDKLPIINDKMCNKRLHNNFVTIINNSPLNYSYYPFLYVNEQIASLVKEIEQKIGISLSDFEELLFIFIKLFEIKIKPDFNDRSSFLFFFHLLFIQVNKDNSLIILDKKSKEKIKGFLFNRILYHHPKPEWFIDKFVLKQNTICYEAQELDIIKAITEYESYITINYDKIQDNSLSLIDFKEVYSVIKTVFCILVNKQDSLLFLQKTNTYSDVENFLYIYQINKSKFYNELIEYLDYFKLSFEPKEIIEEYSEQKKNYNSRVKWRTENQVYSYILYIFNDIDSLKELLFYVQDEKKKQRLLNIIFYHPIITRNNKKYDFISEKVIEILPEGYAKDRVKQLLRMKL